MRYRRKSPLNKASGQGLRPYDYRSSVYRAKCEHCQRMIFWDRTRRMWLAASGSSLIQLRFCPQSPYGGFHDPAPREVIHGCG